MLNGLSTVHKIFLGLIVLAILQSAYHYPLLPDVLPGKSFRLTGDVFPKWQLIALSVLCFALVAGLYFFVERLIEGKIKTTEASDKPASGETRRAPPLQSFGLLFAGIFVGLLGIFEGSYRSYENPNGYGSWITLICLAATFVFANGWALIMASRMPRSPADG